MNIHAFFSWRMSHHRLIAIEEPTYIIEGGGEATQFFSCQDVSSTWHCANIQGQDDIAPVVLCLQEHSELWLRVVPTNFLEHSALPFLCVTLRLKSTHTTFNIYWYTVYRCETMYFMYRHT